MSVRLDYGFLCKFIFLRMQLREKNLGRKLFDLTSIREIIVL